MSDLHSCSQSIKIASQFIFLLINCEALCISAVHVFVCASVDHTCMHYSLTSKLVIVDRSLPSGLPTE